MTEPRGMVASALRIAVGAALLQLPQPANSRSVSQVVTVG
jgi:hypothetical protein